MPDRRWGGCIPPILPSRSATALEYILFQVIELDFTVDDTYLPNDFLKSDVQVGKARHLVFATTTQLEQLARARTWFMGGAFKVVRKPFTQLFSIHAILVSGDNMKQVISLAFVMMSRLRHGLSLDTDKAAAEFGVSGTALSWIQSYLQDRTQFVKLGQHRSSLTTLEVGVPQGSVLGPLLFAVYCSPVADVIASHGVRCHQ